MEARDFAELLKEHFEVTDICDYPTTLPCNEARWGYGDSDFFVETDDGTFLVTVAKVSE